MNALRNLALGSLAGLFAAVNYGNACNAASHDSPALWAVFTLFTAACGGIAGQRLMAAAVGELDREPTGIENYAAYRTRRAMGEQLAEYMGDVDYTR